MEAGTTLHDRLTALGWAPWDEVVFGTGDQPAETGLGIKYVVAARPTLHVPLTSSTACGAEARSEKQHPPFARLRGLSITQHLDTGLGAVVWDCVRAVAAFVAALQCFTDGAG